MVAGVEGIVTIVARYQQVEALYLLRPETVLKQEFERRLVNMYTCTRTSFIILATCYYQRNTMPKYFASLAGIVILQQASRSSQLQRQQPFTTAEY
jgi:hypothetical protein